MPNQLLSDRDVEFVLHELLRAPMPEVALGREPTVAEVLAAHGIRVAPTPVRPPTP